MIDIYNIGTTPEELRSAIINLRNDYDAHNHDGVSSVAFQTLSAETVSARAMLIKKTSFNDATSGIWMGLVGSVMKLKLGTAAAYLEWTGTALNIVGSISGSTITGGTFQTATSGQRIVITSADNTLRFYDATAQVIGIGTTASVAMRVDLNSNVNNAFQVSSTVGGVAFDYTNSTDIGSIGVRVTLSSSGSNNNLNGIESHHGGSGYAFFAEGDSAAGGVLVDIAGTGHGVVINNAGTGNSLQINDSNSGSGTVPAVDITYARAGAAINILVNHSGGNPTGIKMSINNAGGNEYAFEFAGAEVVSAAVTGTQDKKIRVLIGASVYYLACYDA